jgi:Kef-type K+ transport system membrane component KefB
LAGEAEFSFVVAKFGYNEGLFDQKTYASIAFAILLSTTIILSLLRTMLAIYHLEDEEYSQQQQQN